MSEANAILLFGRERAAFRDIASKLEDMGLEPRFAGSEEALRDPDIFASAAAAIIDAPLGSETQAVRVSQSLRDDLGVIVMGLWPDEAGPAPLNEFDALLRHPVHASQAAARLQGLLRNRTMREEAALRRDTLAELGVHAPKPNLDDRRLSVLFVGDPDPVFMGLKSALSQEGAEVIAAFTSFTAFDFLHEKTFHAVVLNALKGNEPAFTMCSAMRRNSSLMHLPSLIMHDPSRFDADDEAFARGASDLLSRRAPERELAERVLSLARLRRNDMAVRRAFDSIRERFVLDPETGLFSRDFALAHLKRMAEHADHGQRRLGLAVARVRPESRRNFSPDYEQLESARAEFGAMLRRLLRPEDFAARLESGVFMIAMPGVSDTDMETALHRVSMVADCTAFAENEAGEAVKLSLNAVSRQKRSGETGAALLQRALDGLATPAPGFTPPADYPDATTALT